jgi:hypothetical protein
VPTYRVGFVAFLSPVTWSTVSRVALRSVKGWPDLWRHVRHPVRWRVVPDFLLMWRLTKALLVAGGGEVEGLDSSEGSVLVAMSCPVQENDVSRVMKQYNGYPATGS